MIRVKRILFLSVLVLAGLCAVQVLCWAAPQLKFNLLLDKTEYGPNDPITISFTLKNTGKEPVIVNQRFYISDPSVPKNQREVYFELTSPSGQKLACKHFYETGLPKTEYFKLLGSNDEAKSDYPRNLRGFFEINEPGVYTVKAIYQNACGQELGLETFKDQLESETVKFTVKK